MTKRPYDPVPEISRFITTSFTARRLATARGRIGSASRHTGWKKKHGQTLVTSDYAGTAPPFSAPLMRHTRHQPVERSTWAIAGHAGRLATFSLTVAVIHILVLWWIFLRIGA